MLYVLVAWVVINILLGFCIIEEYGSPYDAIQEWWETATETVNFVGAIIWVGAGAIFILPTIIIFSIILFIAWVIYLFCYGFKYIFRKRD